MLTRLLTAIVRFMTGDADCSSLIKRILAACWLLDYDTSMWTGNERQILAAHGCTSRSVGTFSGVTATPRCTSASPRAAGRESTRRAG